MKLRPLKKKDAPLMLEWMHDDSVVHDMGTDFSKKTIEDCLDFIEASSTNQRDIHFAITNESDEYMGTVSLKHVHKEDGHKEDGHKEDGHKEDGHKEDSFAEFAITIRKSAMGKGYSKWGMHEILKYGFETVGLKRIYWYVSPANHRAIRFYDKNGYARIENVTVGVKRSLNVTDKEYVWYEKEV